MDHPSTGYRANSSSEGSTALGFVKTSSAVSTSSKSPSPPQRSTRRHCWECRRRCLVCDFTEPACKRCIRSGVECPGYSAQKPTRLRWLTPGKVASRGQTRKAKGKGTPTTAGDEFRTIRTFAAAPKKNSDLVRTTPGPPAIDIPRLEMETPTSILTQAAEYYNACIYKDLLPIHAFGRNPHVYPITAAQLQVAAAETPAYLQYGMVCMTLNHRLNTTRGGPQTKALAERFYMYWGLAVRSLNEHLSLEDRRIGDKVFAGILTLLLVDIQQGSSLDWRCHLEGVHKLIMLRGGFQTLTLSRSVEPLSLVLWTVATLGNTTCPASDLAMTGFYLEALDFMLKQFSSAVTPFQLCPLPLFGEMIRINHLRKRAATHDAAAAESFENEAFEILERINGFSPQQWAEAKSSSTPKADWVLVGCVYHAAVALYCALSLQSLSVLPSTRTLRDFCTTRAHQLHLLLSEGLSSPRFQRFMVWPLVLLGVEAVHGSAEMRAFVAEKLPLISRHVGIHAPLAAKRVLESFWASGVTSWDACFDKPYVFTTQIAVDTSRLYTNMHPR